MTAGSTAPGAEEELTADELLRRLRVPGELTIAEAAALARLDGDPGDDDDWDRDPGWEPLAERLAICNPGRQSPGLDGDLGNPDERGDLSAVAEPAVPEALDAGFTHRYGGTGAGFAAGGPLDVMLPGPDLACHSARCGSPGWPRCPTTSCAA